MGQQFYSKRGYVVTSRLDELIDYKAEKENVKRSVIIKELAWYCKITPEQIYSIPEKTLGSIPVALLMAKYFDCHVENIYHIRLD